MSHKFDKNAGTVLTIELCTTSCTHAAAVSGRRWEADVVVMLVLSAIVVALSLALAFVGYRSVGGTFASAVAAVRRVVASASAAGRRVDAERAVATLDIRIPHISTYRGAQLLVVADAGDATVSPRTTLIPTQATGFRDASVTVKLVKPGDAKRNIDFSIYDADTLEPLAHVRTSIGAAHRTW